MVDNEEIKALLTANLELTQKNNEMLRRLRSSQKRAHISAFIRWLFLVAVAFGLYYYIQPYMEKILDLYNKIPGLSGLNVEVLNKILGSVK